MKTNLYLIRHGEAVVNVQPIVGGMRGDSGLTEQGVRQAERLRDRLAATREIAADVLIASTLPRARQTAEIIAPALGLPIQFDDEVHELRVGAADGMSNAAAWAKFGLPDFEANPFRPLAPGGESWVQFMARVGNALQRITHDHQGKTVVVVCHGGVIDGSFVYFFGMSSLSMPQTGLATHNTSLTHWRYSGDEDPPRWRLVGYNDIFHLRDVGARGAVNWAGIAPAAPSDADHPPVPAPAEE